MSKYGDALDAQDQNSAAQVSASLTNAQRYNPDQYAKAIVRGKELDVPAHLIADNPDPYNRPSKYGSALDAIDAPATHEWLKNVDNAAVAQDDIENLTALESTMRKPSALVRGADIGRALPAGAVKSIGSGFSGIGALNEAAGRTITRGIEAIGLDSVGEFLRKPRAGLEYVSPTRILQNFGGGVKQLGAAIDAPEERQTLATDISGGVGQIGSQIAMMLLTGGGSSTAMLLGQGADIQEERALKAGASEEQTDTAVIAGAGITALTEKYGLDKILNRVPPAIKNKILSKIADVAAAGGIEAAQEVTEGILQNLTEAAVYNPEAPLFEGLERDALAAGGTGVIARSLLNTLLPGRQAQHAEANRKLAEDISTVAQQSKLAQRSPEKLEELVAAIKNETGADSVYIEPEAFRTLFQSDEEAAQFAGELTGDVNTYYEAAVSGSRMAVPIEKYVSRIATNKEALKLLESVSFTPDGPTAKDVKESTEVEARAEQVIDTESPQDTSQAVYDDVLGQLLQSGMERSTAERNATLMQSVFRTLSERISGNEKPDALGLYQKYGLRVGRPEMTRPGTFDAGLDPLIDQLRGGEVVKESKARGPSLLAFIRSKGGMIDEGGELAARDAKSIIKKGGRSLDDMADLLVESGYIQERDPNAVLDLIGKELAGQPTYAAGTESATLVDRIAQLEWIEELVAKSGLDIKTATNEQIKKAIKADGRAELIEYLPTKQELTDSGLEGIDDAFDSAAVARAAELNSELVESLATRYAEDDAGFITAIRGFLNEQDTKASRRGEEDSGAQEGVKTFDQTRLFQKAQTPAGLIIQHSTTAEKIAHAIRMGGLAVPSLAVTKKDHAITGFGDITLIGPPEMADPKGALNPQVFGSDIYSPRYPTVSFNLDKFSLKRLNKILEPFRSEGEREFYGAEINDLDDLTTNKVFKKFASESLGVDEKAAGYHELRAVATELLRRVDADERIFQGYTNSGNRRYIPHTLDNVVRLLKKEMRGGEGFNYGVGSVRAKFTPQFKTVKQITEGKDRLVTDKEFETLKKEIDKEFFELADKLAPFYKYDSKRFGFGDIVTQVLNDVPQFGLRRSLEENQFENVSDEALKEVNDFIGKLRSYPTEYFEAKILGALPLSEFKVAVVPEDTDQKTIDALTGQGIKLVSYKSGDVQDRRNAVDKAALENSTLFQRYEETKRGAITFGADRQFSINLFEKADLSTFLHESGHFYLEVLADIAEEQDAPQQVKDDFDAILKWFGVDSRDQIETKQHEQFARGFEAYLMEGKAPSVELQNLFARFRAWLVSVYRTLSNLNVELTPQVRNVMDRLVATDEEIEAAESQQNYAPIFTNAEQAGMSPEQWKAYKDIATRAHQAATENLTDEAMRVLKREQQAWFKEERAKVLDEVLAEVNQQPVYQALAYLQKGKNADGTDLQEGVEAQKLNKQSIVDKYGKDFLKRLPRGITSKDGASADIVGQMFGFASGDSLVEALANARPKTQLVEMEADARMREKHGDVMTDGSITEVAMKSVHTDERAKVLAAELKALDKKRREVQKFVDADKWTEERQKRESIAANEGNLPDAKELKAIRLGVARIMQSKQVQAIQPNVYRIAEANAGRKAFTAATKGDYDLAYAEKHRQILNHELYKAAVAARAEIDGIVEHMRTFDKKSTRERIARAKGQYIEQIDALRERFDFSNVTNIGQRDALARWVAAQEAAGREVNVPEHLLDETKRVPYKMLTLAQMQGLSDAVKNIEHLAKTKDRMLKNKKAAEWQDAKAELLERVEASLPTGKEPPLGRFELSKRAALADKARGIADSLLRPETIVEWLDGGTTGPWHEYLWNQANDSEDMRESMRDRIAKPLFDLSKNIDRKRRNELQEMVQISSMGRALNRRTLISIALNMGNASNLDKLTRGGYRTADGSQKFTERNLQEIRDALTKQDWEFVQTVWDTVNQLWPDVVDFQKRMGGLVPEKVEAVPVQTKHGVFKGGYFPVVYDPAVSAQGEKQVAGDAVQEIMGQNFTRASTKKGHTKERTKVARPLLLDFESVVTRHMDQVITDLSHREFVLQAMKILDDGELRAQIQNRIGEGAFRSLQGMVRHTVRADGNYGDPAASGWLKAQDYLIRNTAVAALGFRAVTAFGNLVLAPIQASARISPKSILKGTGEFYRHPKAMTEFIHSQSEFMKHRAENLDQTLVETMANLRGEKSFRAQVARAAMSVHRWADFLGTHALWLGKYRDILEQGGSTEDAQQQADKAIRQTQTAGAPKDLSAFERDPQYKAFRMFLGPMVIMGNRIRESIGRKGVVKNWPEAFGTLMSVWFIPAIMWDLATGKGPDDEDEPGDMAMWALRKLFFYPFMTIPFVRDITNIIERKISGQYAPARSVPLAEAGELVFKAGQEAAKAGTALFEGDDVDGAALTKDLLRASGPLMGLPSNQLDVTGQFLWDVYTGEHEPEGVGDLKYLAIRR